ncbi:valine--tRNA ligase [Wenzhouxiangella sp. AB-CW3]|uniref:valine--tRNA ligase n=1 Tax=Wenzhouxiangella sp. AB-CW3 TaxID=2771012 RepID=UPI00168C0B72|nr:valine--tRNA ligase [Wenzhouxiangella sp. AB-CW3]QOC23032.1 valine--tRNA ligase [Wenzhouxiangella sp. AB-CW3]
MDKTYNPHDLEQRWYDFWEEKDCFKPSGEGEPFCILLPPPNVTGTLHMGHAFQHTLMDALIRYQRMKGRDTLWQVGVDHAGIATEMVVTRQLEAEGKKRDDFTREEFVQRVWQWKEESGSTITSQMRRLGASADWSRERFTMNPDLSEAVIETFVRLHEEGKIYRGPRLVNWDPVLKTAISDLEVVNSEEQGKMWSIRYPRTDGEGDVIVATTRPETLLGDVCVAVHPDDERYRDLVGKTVELPLTGRQIPVVADDYVDMEFGTGCVKITPAHDFNDWEVGARHDFEPINIFTPTAELNDNAPEAYRGLDRFEARARIIEDLKAQDLLVEEKPHTLMVPRGDRSGQIIEPYLTDQWFVKMDELGQLGLEAFESGDIEFVPGNWINTYRHWMENLEDWCISRQLWWGHRIPAWYDDNGNIYVGRSEEEVREKHASRLAPDASLIQDPDVLETWFSSALWAHSTLGWPDEQRMQSEGLDRYLPTSVLITGFDIIFFWVARMVMMTGHFTGKVPFEQVYITGLIRDREGQKMSKSKGNILDPIDLIDGIELEALVDKRTSAMMQPKLAKKIEKATREEFPDGIPAFGADALRFTFTALAGHGRDIKFDLGRCEGYRNFINKLWNAARFTLMNTGEDKLPAPAEDELDVLSRWILSRLSQTVTEVEQALTDYRFDLAAKALYEFVWHEFCDWYLELSKPALADDADDNTARATRHTLATVLERTLRLLHPFVPFVTEEIWQRVRVPAGIEADSIMATEWPEAGTIDEEAVADAEWLKAIISAIRSARTELNLAPGKPMPLMVQQGDASDHKRLERFAQLIRRLARIETIDRVDDDRDSGDCAVALAGNLRLLIPLAGLVDIGEELARINKQLERERKGLEQAEKKLANERFVANAPAEVVDKERQRLAEHQTTVAELEAQVRKLEKLA